ncbi:MAG: 2Fe-2S iron-sulfur cluster-binding protein, partial [Vulcanimicrobiaceae bacterium]
MNGEAKAHPDKITVRINRGEAGESEGRFEDFEIPYAEGMVVLDAVIQVQKEQAPDLAIRWNCKAARCGSCSAEINGKPRLQCKTRVVDLDLSQPITVSPLRTFKRIKDLVTDVSWNYRVNQTIPPMKFSKKAPTKVYQSD